jgi:hypothetical protein
VRSELRILDPVSEMSQRLSLSQEDGFAKQRAFGFIQSYAEGARLDEWSYADVSLWLLANRTRRF